MMQNIFTQTYSFREFNNTITDKLLIFSAFNTIAEHSQWNLWSFNDIENYLNNNNNYKIFFLIDKKEIGFIEYFNDHIYKFCIFNSHQHQGYGTLLMNLIKINLKKDLILTVSKNNQTALNFYLKNNFKIYEQSDQMYLMKYSHFNN